MALESLENINNDQWSELGRTNKRIDGVAGRIDGIKTLIITILASGVVAAGASIITCLIVIAKLF